MAEDTTDIPVIDQREAQLRTTSGGFDATGKPAGPAMVDTATPAPTGRPVAAAPSEPPADKGWAVSNDEVNASIGGTTPVLPRQADVPKPSEPGALDVAAAAFRESNLLSASYDRFMNHPDASAPEVPGYTPFDNNAIAGYESYASRFADSNSPQQTQVIKSTSRPRLQDG